MNLLKTSLLALALCVSVMSCSKDESVVVEEANYTIDLNLAHETNWVLADSILVLINQHRESLGYPPMQRDQQYASAYAVEHTKYMIENARISHDNFEFRKRALKNRGAQFVTENVAFGYQTAESVVHAWLNSPGHKRNIESDYTHSGFGIIADERGNYYFTNIFYRK